MGGFLQNAFLTPEQLAERLNVPVSWVYGHTQRRSGFVLPHHKLGRYTRFDAAEVENFLVKHARQGGSNGGC